VLPWESIRAGSSDFEARRPLRQSARHRRERAPGTGPMLVPSRDGFTQPQREAVVDLLSDCICTTCHGDAIRDSRIGSASDPDRKPRASASCLAVLPSTLAMPGRDVFCLADPIGSAADCQLPILAKSADFTFWNP
jgi:hypothetical protein